MIEVKLVSGETVTISYQMDLIMMHSQWLSAQWHPDQVGVQVSRQEKCVQLGISAILPREVDIKHFPNHHQSFYFDKNEYDTILNFFKKLGFPCYQQ